MSCSPQLLIHFTLYVAFRYGPVLLHEDALHTYCIDTPAYVHPLRLHFYMPSSAHIHACNTHACNRTSISN